MREIKFRCWHKEKELMFDNFAIHSSTGDILVLNRSKYNKHTNYKNDSCVIMQFTGLYDMNSVPIYEGDLLLGVTSDKQLVTCEVVYFPCSFRLQPVVDTVASAEIAGKLNEEFNFSEANGDCVLENVKVTGDIYQSCQFCFYNNKTGICEGIKMCEQCLPNYTFKGAKAFEILSNL